MCPGGAPEQVHRRVTVEQIKYVQPTAELAARDVAGARRIGERELIGARARSLAVVGRGEALRLERRVGREIECAPCETIAALKPSAPTLRVEVGVEGVDGRQGDVAAGPHP